ncbi:MAG: hypothetical protein P8Y24_14070 [Gammaproteobacteria bacterium]
MSDNELQSISYRVNQWLYTHPEATKIPHHIEALLHAEQKHIEAERNKAHQATPYQVETKDQIEEILIPYGERKEAELLLADYIDEIPDQDDLNIKGIVEKMRLCRQTGTLAKTIDGDHVHVWDEKCSCSKLCPHESRDETRRLINKYQPHIEAFVNDKPTHRAFFGVFSTQNFQPGQLAMGKVEIIKRLQSHVLGNQPYCKVFFADGPACEIKIQKKNLKIKKPRYFDQVVPGQPISTTDEKIFPNIKGALVVQEDPLGAHDEWNVHLNVILLTEGAFHYRDVRAAWFDEYQLYFNPIDKTNLIATLKETIKYSAQIVASKSIEKSNQRKTAAPPMVSWPHERWLEWYRANKGFRRTRSYGCLYKIKDEGSNTDLTTLDWIGEIKFQQGTGYLVSLIQGDNSGRSYRRVSDMFEQPVNDNYKQGPP